MCSTCGGNRAARIPGGSPRTPIILGDKDGAPSQPVTFLQDHDQAKAGDPRFVTGTGVDQAVEDGLIRLGNSRVPRLVQKKAAKDKADPAFYVKVARNKWIGFTSRDRATRYAATIPGAEVLTRAEVLDAKESE